MSEKVINCPHYGKIISPDFLAGKKRNPGKCPVCGSYRTMKNAKHYTPAGTIQRYLCKRLRPSIFTPLDHSTRSLSFV